MKKNEIYEGIVSGYGTEGEGIISLNGTTAFVPFCLIGEKLSFKVLKTDGKIAYGKTQKIIDASQKRVVPPCPVFGKCGGCALQHMKYEEQLEFKRQTVITALKKIGGIDFPVSKTVPCDSEYRYRNKLALPIGEADGQTVCGFYSARSHRIVPVKDCLIQSDWVGAVISAVAKFSKERGVPAYDESTGKGVLRRIVVREIRGKFIIALVVASNVDTEFLINELEKSFGDFTFLLNINSSRGNALFSARWQVRRGSGYFDAEECGIRYKAGANTFLQVNDDVRAKLYERVLSEADEGAVAVDLYSGGGMLTAMLAKKCGFAYGVEIVEEASRCADELKETNGLQGKMLNICGKVEEKIDEVLQSSAGKKRIIVCDPPRKGMERSAVKAVAEAEAEKIVLVSCNPATLARDLGIIVGTLRDDGGSLVKVSAPQSRWNIECVIPFDMFPQTKWCETLVVFSRK